MLVLISQIFKRHYKSVKIATVIFVTLVRMVVVGKTKAGNDLIQYYFQICDCSFV